MALLFVSTRLLIERKLPVSLKDVVLLVAYKHHGMPDYLPRYESYIHLIKQKSDEIVGES